MARRGENIRKRKDGRWEGRYICPHDGGGKSKTCSVYARSYAEVRKKLAEAKQAAVKTPETALGGEQFRFSDLAEKWLSDIFETKKYSTYVKYRQIYEKYLMPFLEGRTLDDLTLEFMETHILPAAAGHAGTALSDSLEKSIFCVVNQVLAYAEKKYHTDRKTLAREFQKKSKKQIQVFNVSEQERLMNFLNRDMDLYKLGVMLCLHTGLRLGELCALKWSDIDMKNRIMYISSTIQRLPSLNQSSNGGRTVLMETTPKSVCSQREIPINDMLYQKLVEFGHDEKYVIGGEKPIDPRTYQKKFASYLESADIEYRPFHTLRHTFASCCVAYGTDAKALSEILGHSSVQITLNRYVHPSIKVKRGYLNLLSAGLSGQKVGQAV